MGISLREEYLLVKNLISRKILIRYILVKENHRDKFESLYNSPVFSTDSGQVAESLCDVSYKMRHTNSPGEKVNAMPT